MQIEEYFAFTAMSLPRIQDGWPTEILEMAMAHLIMYSRQ